MRKYNTIEDDLRVVKPLTWEGEQLVQIQPSEFRELMNNPIMASDHKRLLLKENATGATLPFHFPLTSYLDNLHKAIRVFINWWNLQHLRGEETYLFLHLELSPFMDSPTALPTLGGTCLLSSSTVKAVFGSFTDAIHIFHLVTVAKEVEMSVTRRKNCLEKVILVHKISITPHRKLQHIPFTNLLRETSI